MKKTLLLVFIHGFKGGDQTFERFPQDLQALLGHSLHDTDVLSIVYPRFETRGDLKECVARFKDWLQNKVIDLEVANETPSPTVDPSVHVILCGHSMGGIVAAETLLSIAADEIVPHVHSTNGSNTTQPANVTQTSNPADAAFAEATHLLFPNVRAVLAFDTPYLGISPGVLAHGAEEQLQEASSAYKAYDAASKLFGWGKSAGAPPAVPPGSSAAAGTTVANSTNTAWTSGAWGKYAMYGGAAAAMASVAGAAYLNWNQINDGLNWASGHLEFVGCLARGAELQARVERVVALMRTHGIGFANFYGALKERDGGSSKSTGYAQAVLGNERTFCVVPKSARQEKHDTRSTDEIRAQAEMDARMGGAAQGKQVRDFAGDPSRSKGTWVKCVNQNVTDEITSHVSMFSADTNPDYHSMLPRARDQIMEWIDG